MGVGFAFQIGLRVTLFRIHTRNGLLHSAEVVFRALRLDVSPIQSSFALTTRELKL